MSHDDTPRLEDLGDFYAALLDAMQHARAAYPAVQSRIRRAAELVIDGARGRPPLLPSACPQHADAAPEDHCARAWALVLYTHALHRMRPPHWEAEYSPAVRDRLAAQGHLGAQVARDFAHDRTY